MKLLCLICLPLLMFFSCTQPANSAGAGNDSASRSLKIPEKTFDLPKDSFVILDSLAYPKALLIVTGYDNFWGAGTFLVVMGDSGQENIELKYHSFSNVYAGSLDTAQLDGKGIPEIIAKTKAKSHTDFERVNGYFEEELSAIDVVNIAAKRSIFSAMPDYRYTQTGPTPIEERVTYDISVNNKGVLITNRKGVRSRNNPDTVNADCYQLRNSVYERCH